MVCDEEVIAETTRVVVRCGGYGAFSRQVCGSCRTPRPEYFEIPINTIDPGERRLRAAWLGKLKTIPAMFCDLLTEEGLRELEIAENE